MPSFRATAMFDSPLAQLRTMRDRNANPCAVVRRAVQRSSVARSSALTLSSVFGRPVIHIPRLQLMSPDVCYIESLGRDTSSRTVRGPGTSTATHDVRSHDRVDAEFAQMRLW